LGPQSSSQIDASGLGLRKTDPRARAASLAQLVVALEPSSRPALRPHIVSLHAHTL